MTTKRCKTCASWGDEWAGRCGIIRTCGSADLATVEVQTADGDGSGYLRTQPEFGCVCWTEINKRKRK